MLDNKQSDNSGQLVGPLPESEKTALLAQQRATVNYLIRFAPSLVIVGVIGSPTLIFWSSIGIVGIVAALIVAAIIGFAATKVLIRNQQARLQKMQNTKLEVYRFSGILNKVSEGGSMYGLKVGDSAMPEIVAGDSYKELEKYFGQQVTAEYISSVAKNYRIYDKSGHGYNFIIGESF